MIIKEGWNEINAGDFLLSWINDPWLKRHNILYLENIISDIAATYNFEINSDLFFINLNGIFWISFVINSNGSFRYIPKRAPSPFNATILSGCFFF